MKALTTAPAPRRTMLAAAPLQNRAALLPAAQPLLRVLQAPRAPLQLSLFSNPPRSLPNGSRAASAGLRTSTS